MVRQLRPRCSILVVGGGTRTFVSGLLNSSGAPQRNYTAFHSRSRICFDELEDSLHHGTGVAKHYLHVSFIQYAHELSRSGVNHCEWRTSTSPSARPYCTVPHAPCGRKPTRFPRPKGSGWRSQHSQRRIRFKSWEKVTSPKEL